MKFRHFNALFATMSLLAATAHIAAAQELRWKTVMGIKESGDVVGVGSGAVTGGAPWETLGGSVEVNLSTGHVNFEVKGLILAVGSVFEYQGSDFSTPLFSGVPIGTPGPVTQVKGTLVCDVDGSANGGNSALVDTPATTLDAQGNAHFSGSFTSSPPAVCSSEKDDAFLIRIVEPSGFANAWIAFGAVRTD
jgi:hypothetical protein